MSLQETPVPQVDLTLPAWDNPSQSPHSSTVQRPGGENNPTHNSLLQALVAPHLLWGLHQQPQALESATQKSPLSPWVGVKVFPESTALGGEC